MDHRELTIHVTSDPINVSADELWRIVGPGFGDVAAWTHSVERSTAEGEPELQGAPCAERVCHVNISGYDQMAERLTHYAAPERELTYRVTRGVPGFVLLAQNHWKIRETGPNQSVAEMTCTLHLSPWRGLLLAPLMRRQVEKNLEAVVLELKTYAETGEAATPPSPSSSPAMLTVSPAHYSRLAKAVGALLALMGLSLLGMYGAYLATGFNALAADLPGVDVIGLMFAASIGAFALPMGGFLLGGGPHTQARLPIAGVALGVMALVRLVGFANLEVRGLVGAAPLAEFVVLGAIAVVALVVRPAQPTGVTAQ
jgi:hypothetical protein